MVTSSRVLACHHIELEDKCNWCSIYRHHSIRQCDWCHTQINTDIVFLAVSGFRPQLICAGCHLCELSVGGLNETCAAGE